MTPWSYVLSLVLHLHWLCTVLQAATCMVHHNIGTALRIWERASTSPAQYYTMLGHVVYSHYLKTVSIFLGTVL